VTATNSNPPSADVMHFIGHPISTLLQDAPQPFLALDYMPIVSRILAGFHLELVFQAIFDGHKATQLAMIFDEDYSWPDFAEELHYRFEWEAGVRCDGSGVYEAAEVDRG
jgi:hypothetical protein